MGFDFELLDAAAPDGALMGRSNKRRPREAELRELTVRDDVVMPWLGLSGRTSSSSSLFL